MNVSPVSSGFCSCLPAPVCWLLHCREILHLDAEYSAVSHHGPHEDSGGHAVCPPRTKKHTHRVEYSSQVCKRLKNENTPELRTLQCWAEYCKRLIFHFAGCWTWCVLQWDATSDSWWANHGLVGRRRSNSWWLSQWLRSCPGSISLLRCWWSTVTLSGWATGKAARNCAMHYFRLSLSTSCSVNLPLSVEMDWSHDLPTQDSTSLKNKCLSAVSPLYLGDFCFQAHNVSGSLLP